MFAEDTNFKLIEGLGETNFKTVTRLRHRNRTMHPREVLDGIKQSVPSSVVSAMQFTNRFSEQLSEWHLSTETKLRTDLEEFKKFCLFLNSWS